MYLSHHGLLVLLLLRDLDGRQLRDSRHQEVHQDVLTVGQLVHHVLQTCGYEFGVEIMVIPVRRKRSGLKRGQQASLCSVGGLFCLTCCFCCTPQNLTVQFTWS